MKRQREDGIIRQTANYQLPLWDAADRILREEFNRGNERVDRAIAATRQAGTIQNIRELRTSQPSNRILVDLSDIDWDAWQKIHVEFEVLTPAAMQLFLYEGAGNANRIASFSSNTASDPASRIGIARLIFLPMRDKRRLTTFEIIHNNVGSGGAIGPFQTFHLLSVAANDFSTLLPDSIVRIQGER